LDTIFGMMHLVWAGGGLQAFARLVLAGVHLLVLKMGLVVRRVNDRLAI
jgi:hypothetical protein